VGINEITAFINALSGYNVPWPIIISAIFVYLYLTRPNKDQSISPYVTRVEFDKICDKVDQINTELARIQGQLSK
jgi:hypothetical protein